MERQNQNQNKNHGRTTAKHKRKRNKRNSAASISSSLPLHDNSHTIFALIVAALRAPSDSPPPKKKKNKNGSHHQLILQLLNQLHLSLLSQIPNPNSFFPPNPNLIIVSPQLTLPVPILSLLPILLTSRCSEIVCKCAEFVGAASLFSLEMNEQITNDDEIVRGLNFALTSSKRRKSVIAACNAALDMSTTSTGRRRLLECSTLNFLMWEGFAHVALHNWYQNQKQSNYTPCDLLGGSLNTISVNLMHVAIKLIGDADPTFRKACLIGAISILSDDEGWLDPNQRTNFSNMIKSINANSRFSDALRSVTLSLGENEDPWQQIRWMHHLDEETDVEVQKTRIPSVEDSEHLIFICAQHKEEAEAAFMQVKSRFCSEVVFEDVEKRYNELLEKYRKVRKQYMSGMLSLHCN
ncbi:hypothetical protein U1Q18_041175 [Sarracenia purpurea var. burkii]